MTDLDTTPAILHRRKFLAGLGVAGGALMLPACATGPFGGFSYTDAIARLLFLSTGRAFERMTAPGGCRHPSVTDAAETPRRASAGDWSSTRAT